MATAGRKTDEVLASARRDLRAQLAVVRDEISRLAGEELALTQALSSLGRNSASSSTTAAAVAVSGRTGSAKSPATRSTARKPGVSRGPRRRGVSKPTANRVKELEGLLADGPKSRNDLAAALEVSPARVQQLLAELGSAVSSQPDPDQRQGKLWALTGAGNCARPPKPTAKRSSGRAQGASRRKPAARRKQAAK